MDLKKREQILYGDLRSIIIKLALPIMLGNFIQTIYNLTDTFFVSLLGDVEVASVGFIWNIIYLVISLGMGLAVAGRSLIAQYLGSGEKEKATSVAGQLIVFSTLSGIVISAIGYILAPWIVKTMGATGDMLNYSSEYLRVIMIGMPSAYVFYSFNAILQGQGNMIKPMIMSGISVIVNIILDPICILVFHWGVKGAAIATASARILLAIAVIIMIVKNKAGLRITLNDCKFTKKIIGKLVKIGVPASLGQATSAIGFTFLNVFVKSFGELTLASFVIGNRINSLVFMPLFGLGNALSTIVGQNIGNDNHKRAKEAFKKAVVYCLIIGFVGGLILMIVRRPIVGVFTNSSIVLEQGVMYLTIIIFSIPFLGVFQCLIGLFQGSGHTKYAMMLQMGRLWVFRVPIIFIIMKLTNWDERSIWYVMTLANIFVCFLGYYWYKKDVWITKTI